MHEKIERLMRSGRHAEAAGELHKLIALRRRDPALLCSLAMCYEFMGDKYRAEYTFRKTLEKFPEFIPAISGLGDLLARMGRLAEAETVHQSVLLMKPNDGYTLSALGRVYTEQLDINKASQHFRAGAMVSRAPFALSEFLSYSLNTGYDITAHGMFPKHFAKRWHDTPATTDWKGGRPLRIGLVGDVFKDSACARVLVPILRHTNYHQFCVYADNVVQDDTTAFMKTKVAAWRDTAAEDYMGFARLLRSDRLDVVVDFMGHKTGNRLPALATNPAPVQLGFVGYPGETFVTANIDPEVGWAYQPPEKCPSTPLPARHNGYVTFGSVHRGAKITPAVMKTWGTLLSAVPNSKLYVVVTGGDTNAAARANLLAAGIPADQLVLANKTDTHTQYMTHAANFDIHLDTFPYPGGATTFDMLCAGVQTITMDSPFPAYMGANIAESVGLGSRVALDPSHYVELAMHAAADLGALERLRMTLPRRLDYDSKPAERFFNVLATRVIEHATYGCCG
jgi:protein O-GlcNAc transferase